MPRLLRRTALLIACLVSVSVIGRWPVVAQAPPPCVDWRHSGDLDTRFKVWACGDGDPVAADKAIATHAGMPIREETHASTSTRSGRASPSDGRARAGPPPGTRPPSTRRPTRPATGTGSRQRARSCSWPVPDWAMRGRCGRTWSTSSSTCCRSRTTMRRHIRAPQPEPSPRRTEGPPRSRHDGPSRVRCCGANAARATRAEGPGWAPCHRGAPRVARGPGWAVV